MLNNEANRRGGGLVVTLDVHQHMQSQPGAEAYVSRLGLLM